MNYSTHYNLNLAEGTDLVNPLTVDVPNYQAIDSTMFDNEQAGVGTATELKSGTIHAITRNNTNQDVFRFTATSIFNAGDTFTVDGGNVTALYPDQSSLKDKCFIVGSEVFCMLKGSQLTVLATYFQNATEVPFTDTNVSYTANNVQTAIENASTATGTSYSAGVSVKQKIDSFNPTKTVFRPAYGYLDNFANRNFFVTDNSSFLDVHFCLYCGTAINANVDLIALPAVAQNKVVQYGTGVETSNNKAHLVYNSGNYVYLDGTSVTADASGVFAGMLRICLK